MLEYIAEGSWGRFLGFWNTFVFAAFAIGGKKGCTLHELVSKPPDLIWIGPEFVGKHITFRTPPTCRVETSICKRDVGR
jgi:hypothetical protein